MLHRYSLADHTLVISFPTSLGLDSITIGGSAETDNDNKFKGFVGKITFKRKDDTWSTDGDYTGSWVHTKNLSKVGTVDLQVSQIAEAVEKLIQVYNIYYKEENTSLEGMTLKLLNLGNDVEAVAEDCYITKIPDQERGTDATTQDWSWTCGAVDFN